MKYFISIWCMVFCIAGNAYAYSVKPCGKITYEGKGAGEVVFDGKKHASASRSCDDCHEPHGLMPALFEMKRGNFIDMRKMELGRSCGYCHKTSMNDFSNCSLCHRK